MPPYCMVCNKDLKDDSGATTTLCSRHSSEYNTRENEARLWNEFNKLTGGVIQIIATRDNKRTVQVVFDTSGGRMFSKEASSRFSHSVDDEISYTDYRKSSGDLVQKYKEAIDTAYQFGYRTAGDAVVYLESLNTAFRKRDTYVPRESELRFAEDWSVFAPLGVSTSGRVEDQIFRKVIKDMIREERRGNISGLAKMVFIWLVVIAVVAIAIVWFIRFY